MRIFPVFLLLMTAMMVMTGCKKSPDAPPVTGGATVKYPASYSDRYFDYPFTYTQTFTPSFDGNKQLASIRTVNHDTSINATMGDLSLISFAVAPAGGAPASYDYSKQGSGVTDHHLLFYDASGRIVKDSLTNPTLLSGYAPVPYKTFFTYSDNRIVITGIDHNQYVGEFTWSVDTLLISDGHINSWTHYLVGDPDSSTQKNSVFQYSSVHNPLFETRLANSLGPLLSYYHLGDFISPMAKSVDSTYVNQHVVPLRRTYTHTTDSLGNITKLLGMDPREGVVGDEWDFSY